MNQPSTEMKRLVAGILAGLTMAAAATSGVYAFAATTSSAMSTSYLPTVDTRGASPLGAFVATKKDSYAKLRAALAKCRPLAGAQRQACRAAARDAFTT